MVGENGGAPQDDVMVVVLSRGTETDDDEWLERENEGYLEGVTRE
jgi:hypothetical protein